MTLESKQVVIDKLRKQITLCKRCSLYKTRINVVPGEGNLDSKLMFIGEAPGRNEDEQGKPFVGRAGQVFDELLSSIGLTRGDIYLCNILKCRPPENRNPLPLEIEACSGSLDIQIKVIDPVVFVPMGNFSMAYIFSKFSLPESKISQVAGKVFNVKTDKGFKNIIPLFHPAVATYNINKLSILKSDFKTLQKFL